MPAARVQRIREGTGKLDAAQDAIAIAGVFDEFADTLNGKHPFTSQQFARLAALGSLLVQQLRPGSALAATTARAPEAILRDQFAALVAQRYGQLQVLAAVAMGSAAAAEKIPALRAAVAGERASGGDDGGGGEPKGPSEPKKPEG